MTAALPMGGQKITGMADPSVSTDGATKNYVDTTTTAFFSTGDVKLTLKNTPDSGWLMFDDGTFGSAYSGSSNSNNVANQPLFNLLFNNVLDANCQIFTSGGVATTRAAQTNAATAWAANCRMSLPRTLGRAMGIAGAGSGFTARALAAPVGQETVTIGTTNLPPYTPAGANTNGAITFPAAGTTQTAGSGASAVTMGVLSTGSNLTAILNPSQAATTFAGTPQGGSSTPITIMQPIVFLNCMVKL